MRNKYRGPDIKARLGSTVIRYKGVPYWCEVPDIDLVLIDMVDRSTKARVDADDPDVDISSLTLGYVNTPHPYNCAIYLARNPLRMYKQGVDLSRLTYTPLVEDKDKFAVDYNRMFCQGFVDSINNVFPTLNEAIKILTTSKVKSVAVSKDIGLLKQVDMLKVYLKGLEVGWMKLGSNKVFVPKTETSWLTIYTLEMIKGWEIIEGVK